jgi:shikimate dehydrogenase
MIKACVIGWPIAHSRSPLIHNYWLKSLGIDGHYDRVAVEPAQLEQFLRNLPASKYVGCNVTLPHKELALPAIDHIDESVKSIGALNTVYVRNGETYATSTDGDGFLQNLLANQPNFDPHGKTIVILGAGGSAKAIIERFLRAAIAEIIIVNRSAARAQQLKLQFGDKITISEPNQLAAVLMSADLLVNTTSQGMIGQSSLEIDLSALPTAAIVADIVYAPLKTPLIIQAENRGLRTVTGLGMLLHQAVIGFEKWFGAKPLVTSQLYDLVATDIDKDYQP